MSGRSAASPRATAILVLGLGGLLTVVNARPREVLPKTTARTPGAPVEVTARLAHAEVDTLDLQLD